MVNSKNRPPALRTRKTQQKRHVHLDANQRWNILREHDQKIKIEDPQVRNVELNKICEKYGVHRKTLQRIVSRAQKLTDLGEPVTFERKPQSGRPETITEEIAARIESTAKRFNYALSLRALARLVGEISHQTLWNYCKNQGLRQRHEYDLKFVP